MDDRHAGFDYLAAGRPIDAMHHFEREGGWLWKTLADLCWLLNGDWDTFRVMRTADKDNLLPPVEVILHRKEKALPGQAGIFYRPVEEWSEEGWIAPPPFDKDELFAFTRRGGDSRSTPLSHVGFIKRELVASSPGAAELFQLSVSSKEADRLCCGCLRDLRIETSVCDLCQRPCHPGCRRDECWKSL